MGYSGIFPLLFYFILYSQQPPTTLTIESIEATFKFNIEIKKQTECAKILELLRLKNSIVRVNNLETQEQEKYQINLKVCIQVAKYLQLIVDRLKTKSVKKFKSAALRGYLSSRPELVAILQRAATLLKNLPDEEME